jgi:hypothetical protein
MLLLRSPIATSLSVTNGAGVGMLTFTIPDQVVLRGLSLSWQGEVLDPAGPLGGLSLSQGRRTMIGD